MNFSKKNHELKKANFKLVSKTIRNIIVSILASTTALFGQVPPTPPSTSNNSTTYSVSDSDNQNSNVSISTSSTSDSYSFIAKHSGAKDNELKDLITKEMGTNNLSESSGKSIWAVNSGDEEVYEIELKKGRLTMEVDKNIASPSLVQKIEALGKMAKTIITGKTEASQQAAKMQREADRLKREADRMQREADRMKREEERIKRNAERVQSEGTARYQKDAKRFQEEAERLTSEADALGTRATHLGSVSNTVRTLLHQQSTRYDARATNINGTNWFWPEAQTALISTLLTDRFIASDRSIVLAMDNSGTYINGKKMTETQRAKYDTMLKGKGIGKNVDFSFYKEGDNIVIIESVDLEALAQEMIRKDLISSIKDKTKFEINGNSIFKDGKALSSKEVSSFNKMLTKFNAIPAPGKVLEFSGKGSYKIGYSIGSRTHIGTWVFED